MSKTLRVILSWLERSVSLSVGSVGREAEVMDLSRSMEGEAARLTAREWTDGPAINDIGLYSLKRAVVFSTYF